jgi:hypothetical protein
MRRSRLAYAEGSVGTGSEIKRTYKKHLIETSARAVDEVFCMFGRLGVLIFRGWCAGLGRFVYAAFEMQVDKDGCRNDKGDDAGHLR